VAVTHTLLSITLATATVTIFVRAWRADTPPPRRRR
jgi:hypothetical protein